jgi:hypothetical protein
MPQFSLKRLFVSVTLIAVGVGMITFLFSERAPTVNWIGQTIWLLAGAFIGAGALSLWHSKWGTAIGALLGLGIQLLLLAGMTEAR